MVRSLFLLMGSLILALLAGCAGLEEPPPELDPPARTKLITMGTISSLNDPGSYGSGWTWELTVDPANPIVGGGKFAADLSGKAIFDERLLHEGQIRIEGGFTEMFFVDLRATVHVREGAIGGDVVLRSESIPYICELSGTECDPANDLAPTGIQGNTDCQLPEGRTNPCGQLVEVPTSDDCDPGGVCDDLGHTGEGSQCARNEFCVIGPVELPLTGPLGGASYEAHASGSVLFGFDDRESTTGFWILEDDGCNDGTYFRDPPQIDDDPGANSARARVGIADVALEFIMGEDSRLEEGIDSCDPHSSPTPDTGLIKFPIQAP